MQQPRIACLGTLCIIVLPVCCLHVEVSCYIEVEREPLAVRRQDLLLTYA